MDVNRERREQDELEKEAEEIAHSMGDKNPAEKLREMSLLAMRLSLHFGLIGVTALERWSKDKTSASALDVGVTMTNRGHDCHRWALELKEMADKAEKGAEK